MTSGGVIRAARGDETRRLGELAVRSKAYWGYSDEFMAACRNELVVSAATVDANPAFVIEAAGEVVGYYILERRSSWKVELEHLFVEPFAIGAGYGRRLLDHALAQATSAGYRVLEIQSDPHAEAFYLSLGAVRVGDRRSDSVPGRVLPLLQIDCTGGSRLLVLPDTGLRESFLEMAREFEAEGDRRYALALSDFDAYLAQSRRWAAGTGLTPDRVPMDEWWLIDGRRVLGGTRLRHRLTPGLEHDGGHIGYDIRPSERRRGNGHRILDLALVKATALNLDRVLLTCETTNAGSARIIEAAGGRPIADSVSPLTGREMSRFWITLRRLGPDSG